MSTDPSILMVLSLWRTQADPCPQGCAARWWGSGGCREARQGAVLESSPAMMVAAGRWREVGNSKNYLEIEIDKTCYGLEMGGSKGEGDAEKDF